MAGIGVELKNILKKNTIFSTVRAYGYAAVVTSGPYVISIITILLIGYILSSLFIPQKTKAFQVIVTYTIAFSLILTSPFQLTFTRYVADRLFEKKHSKVFPTLNLVLILSMTVSFVFSLILSYLFLKDVGLLFSMLFTANLVAFSGVWIVNILLTSLKNYKFIVFSFFISFALIFGSALFFVKYLGLEGLMLSLLIGIFLLFVLLYGYIAKSYPSKKLLEFDFLNKKNIFISLIFIGVFYNCAIWIDKFIFWFHSDTGEQVLSIFRTSILYDIPIFFAYLAIIPGLAVFLLRIETDYIQYYQSYYKAVVKGEPLKKLFYYGEELGIQARNTLIDVLLIQLIADIIIIIFLENILEIFEIPSQYAYLFYVDIVGTTLQLFVITILAFLFYFDRRKDALVVSFVFFILNFSLSLITIYLGPLFYGYGFTLSLLVASVIGLLAMRNFLRGLHYETYMLRS
ncbi:MAG: exopolysaccharide Pel transporter PelG [Aquificae bacterium]|nr:exopolysaccharide Pel transporter PelG [Aquificota bacterium]